MHADYVKNLESLVVMLSTLLKRTPSGLAPRPSQILIQAATDSLKNIQGSLDARNAPEVLEESKLARVELTISNIGKWLKTGGNEDPIVQDLGSISKGVTPAPDGSVSTLSQCFEDIGYSLEDILSLLDSAAKYKMASVKGGMHLS
jgi:hypothetical protein